MKFFVKTEMIGQNAQFKKPVKIIHVSGLIGGYSVSGWMEDGYEINPVIKDQKPLFIMDLKNKKTGEIHNVHISGTPIGAKTAYSAANAPYNPDQKAYLAVWPANRPGDALEGEIGGGFEMALNTALTLIEGYKAGLIS